MQSDRELPAGKRDDACGAEVAGAAATLLGDNPQTQAYQATGWKLPLLRRAVAAGYVASRCTIRRSLHRPGYR